MVGPLRGWRGGEARAHRVGAAPRVCATMSAMNKSRGVVDVSDEGRFELRADGSTAELVYRVKGTYLVLVHTEVPEALEGQGVGGRLVRAAVDRAARDGLTIVPFCPFARGWLKRHPDEAARVPVEWELDG
jgi:predicted GNAT family acetyltransferase